MKFAETGVAGAFEIELERIEDDRGFFARAWCEQQFAARGLVNRIVQVNTALSVRAGTVRGMHFQSAPHAEVKVVSCPRGSVFDVVLDLRPQSPTYRRWHGTVLSGENFRALYVPEGCAHGYQTLEPDSVLTYATSAAYAAGCAGGVRHDDPAFDIRWPLPVEVISKADAAWPAFKP